MSETINDERGRENIDEMKRLLKEIMAMHADPTNPDYNECDEVRCLWCEQVLEAIGENEKGDA